MAFAFLLSHMLERIACESSHHGSFQHKGTNVSNDFAEQAPQNFQPNVLFNNQHKKKKNADIISKKMI